MKFKEAAAAAAASGTYMVAMNKLIKDSLSPSKNVGVGKRDVQNLLALQKLWS